MPPRSIPREGRSNVQVAVIGAVQAVVVAVVTAVTQYTVTVAPLSAKVVELEKAQRHTAAAPSAQLLANAIPAGSDIAFRNFILYSRELRQAQDFVEDPAWDKRCRAWVVSALVNKGFTIVPVDNESAARGESDGIHLGVECRSEEKLALFYSVAVRTKGKRQDDYASGFIREIFTVSDNDLYFPSDGK